MQCRVSINKIITRDCSWEVSNKMAFSIYSSQITLFKNNS